MPRRSKRFTELARVACSFLSCSLAAASGRASSPDAARPSASPAADRPAASTSASVAPKHPTFRLGASGGIGRMGEDTTTGWRDFSEGRAEVSYIEEGLLVTLHGSLQANVRSFALSDPSLPTVVPKAPERETRVDVGFALGWDPLHTYIERSGHRAGLLLVVTALDFDHMRNRVAPLVGLEPGAGMRGFVRVVGPVMLTARGTYQWVMNMSSDVSGSRLLRGRPLGTWRYGLGASVALSRPLTLELGYAGETFDYLHERTQTHGLSLGFTFDA